MTIDGGIVNDEWEGNGSTSLNVSQEVVQEFQMSSVNFDVSSGIGAGGQVNIVTRSGGNDFHGGGYFFFRDHNMAAFPGLRRPTDPLAFNPNCKVPSSAGCNAAQNPFFVRPDPGFLLGGPIKKDKLFFFFNYEYTNQVQAYPLAQDLASLSGLSNTPLSPYHSTYITTRFDYNVSARNSLFARFSHDGNLGFGPYGGAQPLQSSWSSNNNWSDQYAIGITSLLTPNVVNEVHGFYHWWRSLVEIASASQCAPPCLGGGLPSLVTGGNGGSGMVGSSTFYGGVSDNSPQPRQERSYEITETLTWQKGAHRLKFGFDYERIHTNNDWEFCSLVVSASTRRKPPSRGRTRDCLLNICPICRGRLARRQTCWGFRFSIPQPAFTAVSTWDMAISRAPISAISIITTTVPDGMSPTYGK